MLMWPEGYVQMQCQPISVTLKKHHVCLICKERARPIDLISMQDMIGIQKAIAGNGKRIPSIRTAKLQFFMEDSFGAGLAGEIKA